jgi:hypothetical protein
MSESCQIEECKNKKYCKGLCSKHYQRIKRNGSPFISRPENFDKEKKRYCSCCQRVLDKELFGRDVSNKDKIRLRCKECEVRSVVNWQKRNPEKRKRYNQNYKKKNKTKVNEVNARRRAIRRNAQSFYISKKDYKRLNRSFCFFCGAKIELSIDHIIPLNRGGTHGIGNLQVLCISCNCSKQDMFFSEWRYKNAK